MKYVLSFCLILLFCGSIKGEEPLNQWIQKYYAQSNKAKKRAILARLNQKFPQPSYSALQKAFAPQPSLFQKGFFTKTTPKGVTISYFSPSADSKKKPLVFLFHPFGGAAFSSLARWKELAQKGNFFLMALTSLSDQWSGEDPSRWEEALSFTLAKLPVDRDRMFLLGRGQGGQGAFFWGLRSPHLWAGMMIWKGLPLRESGRLDQIFFQKASYLPIFWVSPSIFPFELKRLAKKRKGVSLFVDRPDLPAKLLTWMASKKRPSLPKSFDFAVDRREFSHQYYLRITPQEGVAQGKISITKREIRLEIQNAKEVEIYLNPNLVPDLQKPLVIWKNGKKLASLLPTPLSWKEILEVSQSYHRLSGLIFTHVLRLGFTKPLPPALSYLIQGLHHKSPLVRWQTLRLVRQKGLRPLATEVRALLYKDPNPEVRQEAALTLGKLRTDPSGLYQALSDPSPLVRRAILRALSFSSSSPFLALPSLKDPSPLVRIEALRMIGSAPPFAGKALYLAQMVGDPSPEVRRECAEAIRNKEGLGLLALLLKDSQWIVREGAVRALGKIGTDKSLAYLQEATRDPHGEVRRSARFSKRQVKLLLKGVKPIELALLHKKAQRYIQKADLARAKKVYLKILSLDREDPPALYNMACVESLLKRKNPAFTYLIGALLAGFDKVDLLKGDPDLAFLRQFPRYGKILEAFQKNDHSSLAKLLPNLKISKNPSSPKKPKKEKKIKSPSKEDEIY